MTDVPFTPIALVTDDMLVDTGTETITFGELKRRSDLRALEKEVVKLRAYARRASIVLMRTSGGGSEMFEDIGEEHYASPELCEERTRHKQETIERLRRDRAHASIIEGSTHD